MIIPPKDEARIAANRAKRQLLISLNDKFLQFSNDGQALFVGTLLEVRALIELGSISAALKVVRDINLSPYTEEHPDWPGIKAEIESLFQY